MHDPDAEDVAKAGRGDRLAAARLVGRHSGRLLTVASRMLKDAAEAEDVVQEVFLKLWTHAGRWQDGKAKFETWLYRVTLNACYDRLRRKPVAPLDEAAEVKDERPLPGRALEESAMRREIAKALESLPERQREAILLCHFQDCGNRDAAEIMGLSVEAVESLLARGRRALRSRLEHLKDFVQGHGDGQ